jgi:hypothetical protein
MTIADEKRLEELKNKWKLVYKGTGEIIGHSGPGGAPIYDDDTFIFDGTEDEAREYNDLWYKKCAEQYKHESMSLLKSITDALYGGRK